MLSYASVGMMRCVEFVTSVTAASEANRLRGRQGRRRRREGHCHTNVRVFAADKGSAQASRDAVNVSPKSRTALLWRRP